MDFDVHPVYPALRVAQLDVEDLENSVEETAMTQYKKVLECLNISDLSQFEDEARLVFRIIFWWHSIRMNGATIGQRLMGVLYENLKIAPRWMRVTHFILTIVVPYARARLQNLVTSLWGDHTGEFLERAVLSKLDLAIEFVDILNFLRFLNCGEYRTLTERSLRLHVTKRSPPSLGGGGDYSSMNRELLWHGYLDVMTFIIPFLKFRRYWRRFRRLVSYRRLDKIEKKEEKAAENEAEKTKKSEKTEDLQKEKDEKTADQKKLPEKDEKIAKKSAKAEEKSKKLDKSAKEEKHKGEKSSTKKDKDKHTSEKSSDKTEKASESSAEDEEKEKNKEFLKKYKCICCDDYPIIPCHIGCGHLFCYYCLSAHIEEDENFTCPECGCSTRDKKIALFRMEQKNELSM